MNRKEVSIGIQYTHSVGNYESIKINSSVTVELETDEKHLKVMDRELNKLKNFVMQKAEAYELEVRERRENE